MKHKIEAIDYLRGSSIFMIILIHIILPTSTMNLNEYSSIPFLFNLRSILMFSVVTLVLCSGFSLYLSTKNLQFKDTLKFYKKRFMRIINPWLLFSIISLIFYSVIHFLFKINLGNFTFQTDFSSIFFLAGLPIEWITLRWIVFLMLMLSILFPFLKIMYEKIRYSIIYLSIAYLICNIFLIYNPVDLYQYPNIDYSFISLIIVSLSFILGWSIVYMVGFFIEQLYMNHKIMKKELKITFNFILLFIVIHLMYKFLGLDTTLYLNKILTSPYYISFGLAATFVLLNIFFAYKHIIHNHLKNIFSFFSSNSYWLYLWSFITLILISQFFSSLNNINTYLKLILEFIINCVFITILVILQKKLIKVQKHHF